MNQRPIRRITWLACCCALINLFGCSASTAQGDATTKPGVEELRKALNAGYTSTKDARPECLGRLVFDVPREMQWGVNPPNTFYGEDRFGFTENIHGAEKSVHVANIRVTVLAPATSEDFDRLIKTDVAMGNSGVGHEDENAQLERRQNQAR